MLTCSGLFYGPPTPLIPLTAVTSPGMDEGVASLRHVSGGAGNLVWRACHLRHDVGTQTTPDSPRKDLLGVCGGTAGRSHSLCLRGCLVPLSAIFALHQYSSGSK